MSEHYYKYPKTHHLPWSPGVQSDDKLLKDTAVFNNKMIIITEKMDGENTSLYTDYLHARSLDSSHHVSRDWVKSFHARIAHLIPKGWRLCGENVYAKHTLKYDELESYFYLFSIWDENNNCLSWESTLEWKALLGLSIPAIVYEGLWDERVIKALDIDVNKVEGYVVRVQNSFPYKDFSRCCAKWVRAHHVQTDKHWMSGDVIPNQLKRDI